MLIKKKKRIPTKYYDPSILKNISAIMELDGIGLFLEYTQVKKEDDMSLNKADKEWIVNTVSEVVLESEKRIMAKSDARWEKNDARWEKQFKFNENQLKFNKDQMVFNKNQLMFNEEQRKFNREHKH